MLTLEIDSKELAKKGTGTPQHAQFRGNPSALNSSTKQTGSFNRNRDFQHNIPRAPNNLAVMSDNVKRFWQRLSSFLNSKPGSRAQNNAINLTDPVEVELWMQCWNAAAIGAIATNLNILPRVLLALPDGKESLPPPSIVLNVLSNLLNEIKISLMNKKHNSNERNRNPVAAENPYFADLEMILNVVRDRLRGPSHLLSAGYLDLEVPEMSNIIKLLSDKFSAITIEVLQQFPTDCERMGLLLSRTKDFNDFIQTIVSLPPTAVMKTGGSALMLHNTDNEGEADTGNAWLGWRDQPTVGWLMSTKWLHVPELGSRYANANEYAETVLRMWTLLCFYWGAGAVWPKCCHKEGKGSEDSICGQPMLTSCVHGAHCSSKFNGRPCENSAKWKCCKRNHDVICERCLYYQQTSLVGNPGLHASTDIYDAVVDRESVRREGSIYIASNLQSRKPPRIAPNWKTSYRLQPCALIGIVKLGSSREPLKRSSSIYWAEVVPVDAKNGSDFDWQARANGKIAFRLLSRGDCPALSVDADSLLELGTCLAIIDLRVFVPEVISVLSTFAQESFKSHLDQIPFIQCLIGQSPGVNLNLNYALSKTTVIAEAIKGSEIELIKRLTPDSLARLTQRICQLEQVKSLYGTQLEAFVDGLAGAVHCTQGPPGTGKVTLSIFTYK